MWMHRVPCFFTYYTSFLIWSVKALLFSFEKKKKMFCELSVWKPPRLRLAFIPSAVMAAIKKEKTYKVNF